MANAEKLYPPEGAAELPEAEPITGDLIAADGLYFGMPEDEYHSYFALSSSGTKNLRVSPENFWASSVLNPERDEDEPETESFAKILGTAYHKRITEGRDAFYAAYAPEIDESQFPRALVTAEQIRARLKEIGKPVSAPTKAELIVRLIEADPGAEIFDVIKANYRAKFPTHTFLAFKHIKRIEIAAAMIENDPYIGKAFTGGVPEASVFWHDERGLPRKARFDYLKTKAIVDLKTWENVMGVETKRAIINAISRYKYFVQAAFYFQALDAAKELIRNGQVFAPGDALPPAAFLDAVVNEKDQRFLFCFQQKGKAPLSRGIVFTREHTMIRIGEREIEMAADTFERMYRKFGFERWVDPQPIEEISADEFPVWATD